MSKYIYSTLTADQRYPLWSPIVKDGNNLPQIQQSVLIHGGANLTNKQFVTPLGVVTKVTDEQLECLVQNPAFMRHMERGYIKIEKKELDIEKTVSDMEPRDDSSPLTDGDFIADGKEPPTTGDPTLSSQTEVRSNKGRNKGKS